MSFTWTSKAPRAPLDLGRRQLITAVAAGAVAVPLIRLGSLARRPDEFLIRPPGAQNEAEFLSRCIRCGQCMKVCLTNGLQPVLWEAGLEGLYTSRLIPRMGYCSYTCNLCGQVCPTGAIPHLELKVKQAIVLGTATINRTRCIPYTEGDRLPGVRRTLPRLAQGHHLLRAGSRQSPGGTGENQAAGGDPGPLHRLRPLRKRLPRGRRRRHPGETVAAGGDVRVAVSGEQ